MKNIFNSKYKQDIIVGFLSIRRKRFAKKLMKSFIKTFPSGIIRYQYDLRNDVDIMLFEVTLSTSCILYYSEKFYNWKMEQYKKFDKSILHPYNSMGFLPPESDYPLKTNLPVIEMKGKKYERKN